ncbi:microcystin-dependent protein [Stenotrophomonas sp. 2619]|uniref:phage tail protein n=1 Tax=Stenotrophomonas sp. 2619 TaxID=3156316 RepID=UPI0033996922
MSDSFLGQIVIYSFGFAPRETAQCNGTMLPINQNQALFSLLGTRFGGNGQTTFALPDMRGRVPVGQGPQNVSGTAGGVEAVTLNQTQIPMHVHVAAATGADGTARNPVDNLYAKAGSPLYGPANGHLVTLNSATVSSSGGSQAHDNMQPYSVLNFCMLLSGIYPSRG